MMDDRRACIGASPTGRNVWLQAREDWFVIGPEFTVP